MSDVAVPKLCVICYKSLSNGELNKRKCTSLEQIQEPSLSNAIFTLKILLQIPKELLEGFVTSVENESPGQWVSLCDECIESVVEARLIYEEIFKLSKKFKGVQNKVIDKLKRSWEDQDKQKDLKNNHSRKRKRKEVVCGLVITDECRKSVNERTFCSEGPLLVQDVSVLVTRISGKLSSDNFGILPKNVILLPPANHSFVTTFLDDPLRIEDANQDPLSIPEEDKDPLSIPDPALGDATDVIKFDVNCQEDVEMKPEIASSPENSDSESQQDNLSSFASESEDSQENDREIKTISKRLVLSSDKNKCPTCKKEFRTVKGFKFHLRLVHQVKIVEPEVILTCPEPNCTLTFANKRDFNNHVLWHKRGEPRYKCETCGKAYFDPKGLRQHAKAVHDIVLPMKRVPSGHLQCPKCPKRPPNVISMRHHMLTVHGTEYVPESYRSFPCTWKDCGKTLSTEESLLVHISRHEGKPGYKCDRCEQRFYTNFDRAEHRKCLHLGLPYLCDMCTETFPVQSSLAKHQNDFHQVDKPKTEEKGISRRQPPAADGPKSEDAVQCDLCGKQYTSAVGLEAHKKFIHEQDFQIRCSICNQGMRDRSTLKIHMVQTHKACVDESGVLPQCPVKGCRRVFSRKELLDNHMSMEHGESGTQMRFQCSHCGKGFQNRFKFTQHELLHVNGETKPFKCDICGKGFANNINLRYHQLNTHKAERKVKRRKPVMPPANTE